MKTVKKILGKIKALGKASRQKILRFVDKRPFASFFVILGLLFILIVISNVLGTPKPVEKKDEVAVKSVKVYKIGSVPKLTIQAQVEKSGVIHITALTPGVVQTVHKQAGESVIKGETLVSLASNYQGGNSASLQRQLAQTGDKNVNDVYGTQKVLIKKARELVLKGKIVKDELRQITDQSVDQLNQLVSLNHDILSSVDAELAELDATNVGGINDDLILSTKQLKYQFLNANIQAEQAAKLSDYSSADDDEPAEIDAITKEMALKQLDLQQKMLDMNKEMSRILLQITYVNEAMMYPGAPFNATVQRVLVHEGQQVNPGTELMILSASADESKPTIAVAYVSSEIAKKVSNLEQSVINIKPGVTFSSYPSFVSSEAIQNSLYGVYFNIPAEYAKDLTEKGFIQVSLPIGYFDTSAIFPYIPVDAIYQTKDQAFVFTAVGGKAIAKPVILGTVYGSYVEVIKGLGVSDQVILDRNVITGDSVVTQ